MERARWLSSGRLIRCTGNGDPLEVLLCIAARALQYAGGLVTANPGHPTLIDRLDGIYNNLHQPLDRLRRLGVENVPCKRFNP